MPLYFGFLRAVNIGKRQYRTADLRAALEGAGYTDVDTYIQTGNIRVRTPVRTVTKVEDDLERTFLADRGFGVPTMAFTRSEIATLAEDIEEIAKLGFRHGHYINFLKRPLAEDLVAELTEITQPGVRFVVRERVMHLLYDIPLGTAKAPSARGNQIIGVATNRNAKVVRELVERWL